MHSKQQQVSQITTEEELDIFAEFDNMLEGKHSRKIKGLTNHRKVEVSAMPGKTKVVQTIFIPDYQLKL